jgi:hypothetical protein
MDLHTRLTEEAMTFEDYLLALFYLIDSELEAMNRPPLRSRGPRPVLHDSEVIPMELAGEFLGIDTDKGIWAYFRRCHRAEVPGLARVDRTRFARQAANPWRVKQLLHRRLLALLPSEDPASGEPGPLSLIDSFPLRVCRFKRAPGHKLFRGLGAAFGRDPTGERLFFGFRVHLRCTGRGFCAAAELAPGNVADWPMVAELLPERGRVGIGDRNYWNPDGRPQRLAQGFDRQAPFRKAGSDPMPGRSALLGRLRQVIEPVIGQLATRFHCQRTWARDLWHLTSRVTRKLLSHTAAVLLNLRQGNPPLQLSLLIAS